MGIDIMNFDVPPGDWLKIGAIIVGWIITVVKIDGRLKIVENDIKSVTSLTLWRERIEERILVLRRDYDELRRGRGFIKEEMDGEYTHDRKIKED